MTDAPRTVRRARKIARKIVPLFIRRRFVTTVERITRRTWKAGSHHVGAPRCDMTIPAAQALTELAEDLDTGARDWPEWDPDLVPTSTGPSRQEVAAMEATEAARQAWEQLGMGKENAR